MSLFSTLQTGASGMSTSSLGLGVIGDNIANLNTTGFKSGSASFADLIPQTIGGLAGPTQLGTGVIGNNVATYFSQGSIDGSSSAMDVAISGSGFFQVNDGQESYYTRDGSFFLDNDGYMVTASGLRVQGYQADGGVLSTIVSDIQLNNGPLPQVETSMVTADIELSPDNDTTAYLSALALDGNTELIEDVDALADFTTSVTIYDSLGQPHDVTLMFDQTGADTWEYYAMIDGGEVGLTDGMALALTSGSMTFDTDGNLDLASFTESVVTTATFGGAAPFEFHLDVGQLAGMTGSITAAGAESSLIGISQDGYSTGQLLSVAVQDDGTILGQYDNGEELVLGQLAIATFSSEAGLDRVGGNLFQANLASGEAALGVPGSGGRGTTLGYALEGSNVDLEAEFVAMIQTQRAYQANASVIQTADETLQELVNLT